MSKPVMHIDDASRFPAGPEGGSERFGPEVAPLGDALGLEKLGAMLTVMPPGKRAFPFHNHLGNDGLFVFVEGEGGYRFGDEEYPVRAGSVRGAPKGGPDTARQLINTGGKPLKYIGISNKNDPEIVEYPDSGKYAALAIAPGDSFMTAHLRVVGRASASLDYWDGEDV